MSERKLTPWHDRDMNELYDGDVVISGIKKYVIDAEKKPDPEVLLFGVKVGNINDTPDIMERVYV